MRVGGPANLCNWSSWSSSLRLSFWRLWLRVLLLEPRLERLAQLGERFQAERFGVILVDGDGAGLVDRFHRHLEFGILAGELRARIGARKRHVHEPGLAHRHADDLLLEARNEGPGADIHPDILSGAAFERGACDLAAEIDHGAVAGLDLGALAFGVVGLGLLGEPLNRRIDLRLGDIGHQPLELDVAEIRELYLGQDFQRQPVRQIGLAIEDLLDLDRLFRHRHLGLHGELEPALVDDLGVGLTHHRLDRLDHHRAAIQLLEMRKRHLAGPESIDSDPVLHLAQPLHHPGLEGGGRHLDLKLALETVRSAFGDLHGRQSTGSGRYGRVRFQERAAPGLVRAEGLEPPRLSSREPKSRASTNSATPAKGTSPPNGQPGGAAYNSTKPMAHAKKLALRGK